MKKQKGQIASLDFIMSLVLLTLALGLVFRFTEINYLYLKGQELELKLEKIGAVSTEILLHSPETTCNVKSVDTSNTIFVVPNCLDKKKLSALQSNNNLLNALGVKTGYNVYIKINENNSTSEYGNLASPAPEIENIENIYSEERTVYVLDDSTTFTKAKLEDCLKGNTCDFKEAVITLNVWK